jgi:hypothetical protein
MTKVWHQDPTWHDQFTDFHKLIYTPLDLPPPPEIDWDHFIDWSNRSKVLDTQREKNNLTAVDGGRYVPASKTGKLMHNYPWEPSHAIDPSTNTWNAGFDNEFPELVEYIKLFPYIKLKSVNFIRQKPGINAFLHTDPDDWIGFRFYLKNNVKKNRLYFRKIKPEYANGNRYQTYEYQSGSVKYRNWDQYCQPERIYANQHDLGTHAWALTCAWAAHGIDPIDEGEERITCLMLGSQENLSKTKGFNTDATLDLLNRSMIKFKDRQIWYDR